jgi:hypothetical protein
MMDPRPLQGKIHAFAQRLLQEADGDPVRALGLLVLALEGVEIQSPEDAQRLLGEVRNVLMPEDRLDARRPLQHLAGEVSWEGVQHCLRCAKILFRTCDERKASFSPGYVYEVGSCLTIEDIDDFDLCR